MSIVIVAHGGAGEITDARAAQKESCHLCIIDLSITSRQLLQQ